MEEQDLKIKEACHHLLSVWDHYAGTKGEAGEHRLDCHCTSSLEDAGEFLDLLGYVKYHDWWHEITEKGKDLMEEEF